MGLLDDIQTEAALTPAPGCPACAAVRARDDMQEREALAAALSGTLSERAMVRVARKNQLGFGRDTIKKHRNEGHKP